MNEYKNAAMVKLDTAFEGQQLTFYRFRANVCVVGQELGWVLGYAREGQLLTDAIRGEWRNEFIKGKDYEVLEGEALRTFKATARLNGEIPFSRARALLVLFEPGVNLVSLKTEKDLGVKLRRLFADEVLPKMLRGEPILQNGVAPPQAPVVDVRVVELRMVEAQNDRASLLAQIASMSQAAGAPPKAVQAYLNAAASVLVGRPMLEAAPSVESRLYTAGEIGEPYGKSGKAIGKIARKLGIFQKEGFGEFKMSKSRNDDSTHPHWVYNAKARELIAADINEQSDPVLAGPAIGKAIPRPLDLRAFTTEVPEPVPPPPTPPSVNTTVEGWSLRGLLERFKKAGMSNLTTATIRAAALALGLIGDARYGHQSPIKNEHGRVLSRWWRYHEEAAVLLEETLWVYLRNVAGGVGERNAMTSAVAMVGKVGSGSMSRVPFKVIRGPG
ncbi:hypothetical protein WMF04_24435 [Sorangium sp. So ce260]|uniref:hypothetical protein n=1 Tax=Sorangium sp. So ce260 TaxID=3133291 RepID=UPI003F5FEE24